MFKERFKDSKVVEGRVSWMLPLGSLVKSVLTNPEDLLEIGYCIGDAASLIDPFTGEGIGNAMVSAKLHLR